MTQAMVGIRDLKAQLSMYVQRVKAGDSLVITERGKPVGRIVPLERSLKERVLELVAADVVDWNGQKLGPVAPVARTRGQRMVADLLLEDRE